MIENIFDPVEKILYVKVEGAYDIEDLLKAMDFLPEEIKSLKSFKILEDSRKAIAKFDEDSLPGIVEKLELKVSDFDSIYHAVIQESPTNYALTLLVIGLLKGEKYKIQIFSTEKAAKNWLNNQM